MTFTPDTARAWVDVDLGALVANARTLVGLTGTRLLPMVKANGYGLGAVAVARALEPLDPWGYGVASVEEGAALRAAGIDAAGAGGESACCPTTLDAHLAHDLRPAIGDSRALGAWCRARATARSTSRSTPGWRGPASAGTTRPRWRRRRQRFGARQAGKGVFTHFHSADTDPGIRGGAMGAVPGGPGDAAPPARAGARRQQRCARSAAGPTRAI